MTSEDTALLESLVPHRGPMLLLSKLLNVSAAHASALANIDTDNIFAVAGAGVPAWTGLEMMGQTAALMAGFQQQQGLIEAHTGFLLGSRRYETKLPWFSFGQRLRIDCEEAAVVGDKLATFKCTISEQLTSGEAGNVIASAQLSVIRQATAPVEIDTQQPHDVNPAT